MRTTTLALTLVASFLLAVPALAAPTPPPAAAPNPPAPAAAPKKPEPATAKKTTKKATPAPTPTSAPVGKAAPLPAASASSALPPPSPPPPSKTAAAGPAPQQPAAQSAPAPAPTSAPAAPRVEAATSTMPSPDAPSDAPVDRAPSGDWTVGIDYSYGLATLDVLGDNALKPRELRPTNTYDSSRVTSNAFVLGLGYALGKSVQLAARAPIVQGSIASRSGDMPERGVMMMGNVGVGAVYKQPLADRLDLLVGAELSAPTGGGTENPSRAAVKESPKAPHPYSAIDRFAVARAADYARGSMDSALFEPGRLGLSPSATAVWRRGAFTVRPTVKLESMLDVTGDAPESFIFDAVARAEVGWLAHPMVEPELAAWANWQVTRHEFRDANAVVVEPGVRGHFGWFQPRAALDFPVVGGLADAKALALRLGATGTF